MNINITTYCNLKCPYCFAVDLWKASGNKREDKEISIKHLKILIDFMKRSRLHTIHMLGGEPTLHPKFEEIYDIVTRSGFQITIFSNGIISDEKVVFLSRQRNIVGIVINVQHPHSYSREQWETLNFTLFKLNKFINFGFVIYKINFDAYFIIDLIKKYNLRRMVKWSIAAPLFKNKNTHIRIEDHKKVIPRFIEYSRIFKKYDIRWYPDTTFMWCLFTKKQLDELKRNVRFVPQNLCGPVLEVAPNLSVYRCYGTAGLGKLRIRITQFKNEKEAGTYFLKKEACLKKIGVFKECLMCNLAGSVCGGGCMVEIVNSLFPGKDNIKVY